jgi:hypothetical protein
MARLEQAKNPRTIVAPSPVPDVKIYPMLHDFAKQKEVYEKFMSEKMDLSEAAKTSGVPESTAFRWAHNGRWIEKRSEVIRTRAKEEAQKLELLRISKRQTELEAQIKTGQQLREHVDAALQDPDREYRPMDLKLLGEAAKSAGDLTVRALGIGDGGGTSSEADGDEKSKGGKAPLVVLIQGGGLPPVRMRDAEPAEPAEPAESEDEGEVIDAEVLEES